MADQSHFLKVGCLPQIGCKPLHLPLNYDAFSPFVEAEIGFPGGPTVTVGNESYPARRNTAIVKSMEFGYIDKPRLNMEIVDEAGGEIDVFMRALSKCNSSGSPQGTYILLKFGWVKSDCEKMDENGIITFGGHIRLMISQLDVAFGGGLTKYTIEANPLDVITTNQRKDNLLQSGTRLVDAIKITASPAYDVIFRQVEADGSITSRREDVPWEWEGFGEEGPRGIWQADNTDVISTIAKWISPYRIKHGEYGAGISISLGSKSPNELVIMKDPKINGLFTGCQKVDGTFFEPDSQKRTGLGTFIVNGGKLSPVIRFDPKFNLIAKMAGKSAGGATGSASDSATKVTEDMESKEDKNCLPGVRGDESSTGQEQTGSTEQSTLETYPADRRTEETLKSNMAHMRANLSGEFNIADIQGDLTIIGMPTDMFIRNELFFQSQLSIIVLNPFFVGESPDRLCGEWSHIVGGGCNEILSDRNYICKGINHTIREGSYTTTIKVLNASKVKTGAN